MPKYARIGALAAVVASASFFALGRTGETLPPPWMQSFLGMAQSRPPMKLGVVLSTTANWNFERSFANLASVGEWMSAGSDGWHTMDRTRLTEFGAPTSLRAGETAVLTLAPPPGAQFGNVSLRCTFQGHGRVQVFQGKDVFADRNRVDFTWTKDGASLLVTEIDAKDPARNFDCRERNMPRDALFDPAFVKSIRPFASIRFLDWQRANDNNTVTWATRTRPDAFMQDGPDGVAVEHMVALANLAHTDPWFCMPWNADAEYLRKFAAYVHDHLDPGLVAYVETGNEIWNAVFRAAQQAQGEGLARGLSDDGNIARMRRYSERSVEVLDIFAKAFADNPKRLVRVLSGMAWGPGMLRVSLEFKDTAKHVDALAIAPYFGFDLLSRPNAPTGDIDALFRQLDLDLDSAIHVTGESRELADKYKLRLLAYEAGQHITTFGPDRTIVARLNRDPRMKKAYEKYIAGWNRDTGDLMMMFASTSPAGAGSAWGLQEQSGQPLAQAPKLQAVLEAIAQSDQRDRLR